MRRSALSPIALSAAAVALAALSATPADANGRGRGVAVGVGVGILGAIIANEVINNQRTQPQQQPRQQQVRPRPAPQMDGDVPRSRQTVAPVPKPVEPLPVADAAIGDDDVMTAQLALNRLGFDVGEADGEAGPRTSAGVRAFQNLIGERPTGTLTKRQHVELLRRASLSPGMTPPAASPPTAAAPPQVVPPPRPQVSVAVQPAPAPAPQPAVPAAPVTYVDVAKRFHQIMGMGVGAGYLVQNADISENGAVTIAISETVPVADPDKVTPGTVEVKGNPQQLIAVHDSKRPSYAHLAYYDADHQQQILLYTVVLASEGEAKQWAERLQVDLDQLAGMTGHREDPYADLKSLRPRS